MIARPGEVDGLIRSVARRIAVRLLDGLAIDTGADAPIGGLLLAYWDGGDAAHWVCEGVLIPQRKAAWCREHDAPELLWDINKPEGFNVELSYYDIYDGEPDLLADGERLLQNALDEGPFTELPSAYYLVLADELTRLTAVPFVATSYDGSIQPDTRTQLMRRLSADDAARWTELGWLPPLNQF
jgi:hypothetical protein